MCIDCLLCAIVLKSSTTHAVSKSNQWFHIFFLTLAQGKKITKMNYWQKEPFFFLLNPLGPRWLFTLMDQRSFSFSPQLFLCHFSPRKWAPGTFQGRLWRSLWLLDPYYCHKSQPRLQVPLFEKNWSHKIKTILVQFVNCIRKAAHWSWCMIKHHREGKKASKEHEVGPETSHPSWSRLGPWVCVSVYACGCICVDICTLAEREQIEGTSFFN